MAKKLSGFGAAFAEARADGKKTFEYPPGSGKRFTTQTKEEKDREVTPEAKKVMDQTRRDREGNFRAQARKADVAMETPEERGAMNLEGFKRERGTSTGLTDKDRDEFKRLSDTAVSQEGRLGTMKRGGSVKSSAPKMGKVKTAKPSMGGASKRADGIANWCRNSCRRCC
jgi:hypothetical protein